MWGKLRIGNSAERRQRLAYWRGLTIRELWPLLVAVFLLFSVLGFSVDLLQLGREPIPFAVTWSLFCGSIAVLYILLLTRSPKLLPVLIAVQIVLTLALSDLDQHLRHTAGFPAVDSATGTRFAAAGSLAVVMASYAFFLTFIQNAGAKVVRAQTELSVAHSIQEKLVPILRIENEKLEVFAQSRPREKVGGELTAVVERNRVTSAYIADVSGHGMQSGLLMNMLTTAIRTALLRAGSLTDMLHQVNFVLPDIKEPQMYATFAGLRFETIDAIEFVLCGHPPMLWFQKELEQVTELRQSNFPVGLLPAVEFTSAQIAARPGDVFVLLTDGILEACDRHGEEFGLERVRAVVKEGCDLPLSALARRIFDGVDAFAGQLDDQTLLLMRLR